MHKFAYLSLGSNVGDREANLRAAIDGLTAFGKVAAVSALYETEPVELVAQPWFLNCAVKLETEKMPRQLLSGILALERKMGRRRVQKKGAAQYRYRYSAVWKFGGRDQGIDDSASGVA